VPRKRGLSSELGKRGEELASRYLSDRGLRLIARNYRCRHGEIDLIMHDGSTIVFVEVRLRSRIDYGTGAESVDAKKKRRILSSAEHYLQRHASSRDFCRFDIVSILRSKSAHQIDWIRSAFTA